MIMLVDLDELKKVRPIAESVSFGNVEPYIEEVENMQIRSVVGTSVFNRIIAEPDTILLSGGDYKVDRKSECEGDELQHCFGLRDTIAYLVYARMLPGQQQVLTAIGLVTKTGDHSAPSSEQSLIREVNHAQKVGETYLQSCIEYMKHLKWIPEDKKVKRTCKITAI